MPILDTTAESSHQGKALEIPASRARSRLEKTKISLGNSELRLASRPQISRPELQ